MPFRSAQTLPTNSPCWVTPPNRNVLIWLNQGAITDPYFSGQEYCILANSAWVTPKVLKAPCRLCPSGASSPGLMQLPSSVRTSIGFITLIPRGRSGQKNPRQRLVQAALGGAEGGVERPVHELRRGAAPVDGQLVALHRDRARVLQQDVLAQRGVGEEVDPVRAVGQLARSAAAPRPRCPPATCAARR